MRITVLTLDRDRFEFDVGDGATVLDAKETLQNFVAVKPDSQRLVLGKRNLEDHSVLQECGIKEDSCLLLLLLPAQGHEEAEETALIIDCGSFTSRVGLSGDDAPRSTFPTVVGRPKHPGIMVGMCGKDVYVGDEAQSKRGILTLKFPVEHGIITNWDHMERIWHHSFYNELRVAPEEHPVLVTEAPLNPKANRAKVTQIMFESFNVTALHIASQPVLALQHEQDSPTTGIVVDIGHTVTRVVPICEGCVVPDAVVSLDIGGADLTDHLCKLLCERGYSFQHHGGATREIANDMKHELCHVAMDFQPTLSSSSPEEKAYELPDGQVLTIGNEVFRCPEILFQPCQIGKDSDGIVDLIFKAIGRCDQTICPQLCRNIVLAGGTSLLPGMDARMENDMIASHRVSCRVSVVAPRHREHASWIGGSILASRKAFQESWMKISDYDEHGPDLVNSWPQTPCAP